VVAGVIGIKKFSYDLWCDTVNFASRMESQCCVGAIQVSEETYFRLQSHYRFHERDSVSIKGCGEMKTYLLLGRS
jgi:adenylate cyclase